MQKGFYIDLLLPLPVPGSFTYGISEEQAAIVKPGMRVSVSFGKKSVCTGLVLRMHHQKPLTHEVKEIISVIDAQPVILESQIRLWEWVSAYYMCTPGEVFKAALPQRLKLFSKPRRKHTADEPVTAFSQLNASQLQAFREIKSAFESSDVVLLHGVTSSGKTEIYIHLMKEAVDQERQVLYMLPEIALTTQIISRLKAVFGNCIAVYHSKSTDSEKVKTWNSLLGSGRGKENPIQIILGVRSSVFLPYRNPGLIIIDEEHENTYKQFDPAPRYHARDTAIMLAQQHGAKVLLGTATPSVETYYNCISGKYKLVTLNERYLDMELPDITVVNTRELQRRKQMQSHFSPALLDSIDAALKKKEQVILFQNRRGFSLFLACEQCGEVPRCRFCDVSLTYHKKSNRLNCHYCGYTIPVPLSCGSCGHNKLHMKGFGTEKIEEEIALFFPEARVERMDLDATRSRKSYEQLITRFEMKESDILVGTQMVSKGLDFDNVKLVGIMDADTMLNYPDFRAYERSYQLMAQVSGRAGRKFSRGAVIIQTSDHNHPIIRQVVQHDYRAMFNDQLEDRRKFRYPPFSRLVEITLKHRDKDILDKAAVDLATLLRQSVHQGVMGPEYPLISRIRNLYLKSMLVKIEKGKDLAAVKQQILMAIRTTLDHPDYRSLQHTLDVDPY
jgi:primosomal protein N' (replication factor Y) (superfamily II helicase)